MKRLASSPFWLPFVMAFLLVLSVAALSHEGQVSKAAALKHSSDSPAAIGGFPRETLSGVANRNTQERNKIQSYG